MVSISYGHGTLNDGDSLTGWAEVENGNTGTTTIDHGDYLNLNITVSAAAEEYYWDNDVNLGLSTTTYTKIRWRYMTSDTSIKAKIVLEFGDASTQEVLADSSSTSMTVGSATITPAKTLDHIRLHADHATGDVWYDFVIVYKDDWDFPNVGFDILGEIPINVADLAVPRRLTDVSQNLGSGNLSYRIGCDMNYGDWTRTGDDVPGQVFYDIAGNAKTEPWQWFDSDREQMKATLRPPRLTRAGTGSNLTDRIDLMLQEYRLSSADNDLETYETRWGLDL